MAMDKERLKRGRNKTLLQEDEDDKENTPELFSSPGLVIGLVHSVVCSQCGELHSTTTIAKAILLARSHKKAHGLEGES